MGGGVGETSRVFFACSLTESARGGGGQAGSLYGAVPCRGHGACPAFALALQKRPLAF